MKKFLLLFILLVAFFALAACGNNAEKPDKNDEEPSIDDEENGGENKEENSLNLLGYTLVYDQYVLGMKDLAESFKDRLSDECELELSVLESEKAKREEYRILVGKISSDSSSSKEAKRLSELTSKISSAYSIKFSGKTLMVSGTSIKEVERALDCLFSLIKGGEFKIDEDFSKTEILFEDTSGEIVYSEKDFKSTAQIASIKLNEKKLDGFSALTKKYEFEYSAAENYPLIEVKTVNPLAKAMVTLSEDNGGVAKITVTAEDGESKMDYEIAFKYKDSAELSAVVVNKDAKGGVITFVFDDGDLKSADIIISKLMKKYPSVRASFGIICNQLATAEKDGDGFKLTPQEYSYIPIANSQFSKTKYKYEFWKRAVEIDGVDVLSHSYSHSNEGVEKDPIFELEASQAILKELCGSDAYFYVMPGVGTVNNPNYINTLDGGSVYFGARSTSKKVNFANEYNPFRVSSYPLTRHSTKLLADGTYTTDENSSRKLCLDAGIEAWTNYIDDAVNNGAWACYCIHSIAPAGTDTSGKWVIFEEQLDALFKYADKLSDNGDAWVANFTEASIYYREWKESKITATLIGENSVSVKLECSLDSSVFNMPLTLKVPVPKSWTSAKMGSEELTVSENDDGTKYVYVNVAPGKTVDITK